MNEFPEYHEEPVPGLPGNLPAGEKLLWQGKPDAWNLAVGAFHVRKLALYFVGLMLLRVTYELSGGASTGAALTDIAGFVALAAVALGLLGLLAWLIGRSTIYTITGERIVMRFGVALPITVNLPFSRIAAAELRPRRNGFGDIAILPATASRLSYVVMWPHARPWCFAPVRPMLRAVPAAAEVADVLAAALASSAPAADLARAEKQRKSSARTSPDESGLRPLAAAGALIAITIVTVALYRFAGFSAQPAAAETTVAAIDLRFEDRAGGVVAVLDAADGELIHLIEPGSDNFVRATVRGLVRGRRARDAGADVPFSLRQTAQGRLLLVDPVSAQTVDLWAFGATNARSFARFLPPREPVGRISQQTSNLPTTIGLEAVPVATLPEERQP